MNYPMLQLKRQVEYVNHSKSRCLDHHQWYTINYSFCPIILDTFDNNKNTKESIRNLQNPQLGLDLVLNQHSNELFYNQNGAIGFGAISKKIRWFDQVVA
jgi:hypothetical protein